MDTELLQLQKNLYQVVRSMLFCELYLAGDQIEPSCCELLNFLPYEHLLLEKLNSNFTEISEGDSCSEF